MHKLEKLNKGYKELFFSSYTYLIYCVCIVIYIIQCTSLLDSQINLTKKKGYKRAWLTTVIIYIFLVKKKKKTNNVNLLRQISFMNKVSIKIMTSYLNMISCYKNGVLHWSYSIFYCTTIIKTMMLSLKGWQYV